MARDSAPRQAKVRGHLPKTQLPSSLAETALIVVFGVAALFHLLPSRVQHWIPGCLRYGNIRRRVQPESRMTDDDFLAQLESSTLMENQFHRADHLRAAWLYLTRFTPSEAIAKFSLVLRAYATSLGKADRYHETITWAFLFHSAQVLPPRNIGLPASAPSVSYARSILNFIRSPRTRECRMNISARHDQADERVCRSAGGSGPAIKVNTFVVNGVANWNVWMNWWLIR